MNKNILAASIALVGTLAMGSAQAYQVNFGQNLNSTPSVPLTEFGRAQDARDVFSGGETIETQGFEGLPAGAPPSPPGTLDLFFGEGDRRVKATLAGTAGQVKDLAPGTTDLGRFSVGLPPAGMGTKYWETTATSTGATFELWFDNPVVKFGFFGIDIGDFGGLLELEILGRNAAGEVITLGTVKPGDDPDAIPPAVGSAANGSVMYLGVTAEDESQYFRGVRFRSFLPVSPASLTDPRTAPPDVFAFDSFTVVGALRTPGTPVSAPGSLALLGTALVGLGLMRRRT